MIVIDVISISTMYLFILEDNSSIPSLKLNKISHIPGSKMDSILYTWK